MHPLGPVGRLRETYSRSSIGLLAFGPIPWGVGMGDTDPGWRPYEDS
jgi:hypothetical protein